METPADPLNFFRTNETNKREENASELFELINQLNDDEDNNNSDSNDDNQSSNDENSIESNSNQDSNLNEEEGKVRKFKMEGWMMGRGRKETLQAEIGRRTEKG